MIDINNLIDMLEGDKYPIRTSEMILDALKQQQKEIEGLEVARDFSISRNQRLEFALNKCKKIMDTQQDTIKLLKGEGWTTTK